VSDPSEDDIVLASAARFLVDGGEEDAASVLLSCSLEFWRSGDTWYVGDETHAALHVTLTGARAAYEILNDSSHPTTRAIRRALEAVLPDQTYVKHFTVRAQHVSTFVPKARFGSPRPLTASQMLGVLSTRSLVVSGGGSA